MDPIEGPSRLEYDHRLLDSLVVPISEIEVPAGSVLFARLNLVKTQLVVVESCATG